MVQLNVYSNKNHYSMQTIIILLEELNLKYKVKHLNNIVDEIESLPIDKNTQAIVQYDKKLLFEQNNIMRYISKHNVENNDLYGDTETDTWLEVGSNKYKPIVFNILNNKDNKDYLVSFEKLLDIYEKRLANNTYIGGNTFTIADIIHIPFTNLMLKAGYKHLYKKRPRLYKWIKRIIKRNSVETLPKNDNVIEEEIKDEEHHEEDEDEDEDKEDENLEEVKEDLEEMKEELKEELKEEVKEELKEDLEETKEEMKEDLEETKEETKEEMKEDLEETKEDLEETKEEMKEEMKEEVKNDVKDDVEEVKDEDDEEVEEDVKMREERRRYKEERRKYKELKRQKKLLESKKMKVKLDFMM